MSFHGEPIPLPDPGHPQLILPVPAVDIQARPARGIAASGADVAAGASRAVATGGKLLQKPPQAGIFRSRRVRQPMVEGSDLRPGSLAGLRVVAGGHPGQTVHP